MQNVRSFILYYMKRNNFWGKMFWNYLTQIFVDEARPVDVTSLSMVCPRSKCYQKLDCLRKDANVWQLLKNCQTFYSKDEWNCFVLQSAHRSESQMWGSFMNLEFYGWAGISNLIFCFIDSNYLVFSNLWNEHIHSQIRFLQGKVILLHANPSAIHYCLN